MNKIIKKNIIVIVIVMCIASSGLLGVEYYNESQSKQAFYFQENLMPIIVNEVSIHNQVVSKMQTKKNTKELTDMMEGFYDTYGVRSNKENIVIKGYVASELDSFKREEYVKSIFKNINAKARGHFKEEHTQNSEAYYGYTRKIKVYIRDENQHKNNIQIAFKYNKDTGYTELIVAIPFYNGTF